MLYAYEVVRYTDRPGRENMCVRVSECELSVCTSTVEYVWVRVGCTRARVWVLM